MALLSFPIYFFSAKKLVTENIKQFPLIVFLALISIHWVFDYFSLSRGYAPSVAFLMLGMSLIPSWNKEGKPFYLAIILVSFTLCLGSNLSMFVPVLLLFAYLHLTLLIQWKQRTLGSKITSYIISAGFLYVTYKLFKYVLKLKEAGALWWGSKKGLWEVTGKSVSENVFFTSAESIKLGIGMVHQHFMLIQSHTIVENIALGLKKTPLLFPQKKIRDSIVDFSKKFNFKIEPEKKVWQLSAGEQQRIEIIKRYLTKRTFSFSTNPLLC